MFLKEIDGGLGLPSTEVPAVLLPFFFFLILPVLLLHV